MTELGRVPKTAEDLSPCAEEYFASIKGLDDPRPIFLSFDKHIVVLGYASDMFSNGIVPVSIPGQTDLDQDDQRLLLVPNELVMVYHTMEDHEACLEATV